MDIIFSPTAQSRVAARVFAASQAGAAFTGSAAVDTIVLFDTTISALRIEASNNYFASTVFTQIVSAVSSTTVVTLASAVTATQWRVVALASGTVGAPYFGQRLSFSNPVYPYAFEPAAYGQLRRSTGGQIYSRLDYVARRGNFLWAFIPDSEVASWRALYTATAGLRQPFVLRDPLTQAAFLVTAASDDFPLQQDFHQFWTGRLVLDEVL